MTARWVSVGLLAAAAAVAPSQLRADESAAAAAEQAGRLREAFSLYVAAYQALPDPPAPADDFRLRERIIKLAARLDPPPEVPEEAQRLAVRAQVLVRQATTREAFAHAARELSKAVRLAPWHTPLTFNLALVRQKAGFLDAARSDLLLYLSFNPDDDDEARAKLYEVEMEAEQAQQGREVVDASREYLATLATIAAQMDSQLKKNGPLATDKRKRVMQQWADIARARLDEARQQAMECEGGAKASCDRLVAMRTHHHVLVVGLVARPGYVDLGPADAPPVTTVASAIERVGGMLGAGRSVRVLTRIEGKQRPEYRKAQPGDLLRSGDMEIEIQD